LGGETPPKPAGEDACATVEYAITSDVVPKPNKAPVLSPQKNMKTMRSFASLALAGAAVIFGGCSNSDNNGAAANGSNQPAAAAKPAMQQVSNAAVKAGAAVQATASSAADTATKATAAVAQTATATAAQATDTAQSYIDQAKNLVAQKQYQPALDALQKLANYKLTPDQQTTVDSLKSQIQKLMSSGGANVISNLMGR
jgi:outer membrane PBP1 activator LpoA protein